MEGGGLGCPLPEGLQQNIPSGEEQEKEPCYQNGDMGGLNRQVVMESGHAPHEHTGGGMGEDTITSHQKNTHHIKSTHTGEKDIQKVCRTRGGNGCRAGWPHGSQQVQTWTERKEMDDSRSFMQKNKRMSQNMAHYGHTKVPGMRVP